jgi:hypothetical protein
MTRLKNLGTRIQSLGPMMRREKIVRLSNNILQEVLQEKTVAALWFKLD